MLGRTWLWVVLVAKRSNRLWYEKEEETQSGIVWVDGAESWAVCVVVNGKVSRAHLMRFTYFFFRENVHRIFNVCCRIIASCPPTQAQRRALENFPWASEKSIGKWFSSVSCSLLIRLVLNWAHRARGSFTAKIWKVFRSFSGLF